MLRGMLIVATLLLLLALLGCVQQPAEEPKFLQGSEDMPLDFTEVPDTTVQSNPAPIPGNCQAVESIIGKNTCIYNSAVEESNVGLCAGISEQWMRNNCIADVARQKLDISICSRMESAYGSDNTNVKYSCIADVALEVLYTDECATLATSDWELRCWNKAAGICNSIASQSWKELCIKKLAVEIGDETRCEQLHGFEKDTCLEEIAASLQKPSICDSIEDAAIKESCLQKATKGVPYLE